MDSEVSDLAGIKAVTVSTLQVKPSEGAFADGDKTKLDGIEASADVTDATNVTAAGALMDSEVTDLAGIKAITVSTLQVKPSEGAFADGDKTKLDGIEASADVTDATNVAAAGALMTSGNQTVAGIKTFSNPIVSDVTGDLTGNVTGNLNGTIHTNTTAITQTTGDNSTKVATTAYVDAEIAAGTATNVSGVVGVSNGGTGASSAAVARNNLGFYAFRLTISGGSTTENINLTDLIFAGHLPSGYIFTGNEIITATLNQGTSATIASISPTSVSINPDLDVLRITSVGDNLPSGQVSIIIIP